MSANTNISRNIAGTILVQIPNYLFGIIAGIFLTRQLGPESKGVHTLLTTNISLMVMFLGIDIPGAIQFFISNKRIDEKYLTGITIYLFLIGSLIVFFLLFIIPDTNNLLLQSGFDTFFFKCYFFIAFFINNLNSMISGFLQGYHRFNIINKVSLINAILNLVTFSLLYFLAKSEVINAGLMEVLTLSIFILLVNFILLFFFYRKLIELKLDFRIKKEQWKILLGFIIPAYISILINFFNYRLTIWLVNYHEGNEQLGYFSLALNFAQMLLMVTLAINTVLFPYFASKSELNVLIRNFKLAFKINMIISFGITIFILLFSPYLIPLFYTEQFNPSIEPVQIIIIGTFFCSMSQMFGYFFGARGKNWINSSIYLIALLTIGLLGNYWLIQIGMNGAAYASSISYIVMFILFYIMFRLHYKVSFFSMFVFTKEEIQRIKTFVHQKLRKETNQD